MMTRSGISYNYADDDINKSKMKRKWERREVVDLAFLEGDAWNIATYELVPDLRGDPFIVGYHIP